MADFQSRVQPWMLDCFNPEIAGDKLERNDRFIEEALELIQASGYSAERAHALVDYVFNRPQGEINQEVGGVMVTLAAHCLAHNVNMHEAGEVELARINQPAIITKIRAKQASKPTGSALPIAAKLWCCHVRGPDDLIPYASELDAHRAANEINKKFGGPQDSEFTPIISAVVTEWPYSAEDHASDLAGRVQRGEG